MDINSMDQQKVQEEYKEHKQTIYTIPGAWSDVVEAFLEQLQQEDDYRANTILHVNRDGDTHHIIVENRINSRLVPSMMRKFVERNLLAKTSVLVDHSSRQMIVVTQNETARNIVLAKDRSLFEESAGGNTRMVTDFDLHLHLLPSLAKGQIIEPLKA